MGIRLIVFRCWGLYTRAGFAEIEYPFSMIRFRTHMGPLYQWKTAFFKPTSQTMESASSHAALAWMMTGLSR